MIALQKDKTEVHGLISKIVLDRSNPPPYWYSGEKLFYGKRDGDTWLITEITNNQNSFKPKITLQVRQSPTKTEVAIKFNATLTLKLILVFWYALGLFYFSFTKFQVFAENPELGVMQLLVYLFLGLLAYGIYQSAKDSASKKLFKTFN